MTVERQQIFSPRGKQLLSQILVLFVGACPTFRKPGCETDNDCKGDRVCEAHGCVTPPRPSPCPLPAACPSCPECPAPGTGASALQPEHPVERPPQEGDDADPTSIGTGRADVRGSMSKEVIRRIVRRHINEVKHCYQRELVNTPGLSGRVLVQFTIAATGQVVVSRVQSSTLSNPEVESCIARAVRRWLFPKPEGGGIVIVSYPFVLKSAQ